ncbi:tRNA lysidine(34) synthetase TilS [Candidatus Vidania fulgoroideorum]
MKIFKLNIYKKIINNKKRIGIAYSGGLDSSILLKICTKIFFKNKIYVIHINHNLDSHSKEWENFCKSIAYKKKLIFKSKSINISKNKIKKNGIEAECRNKRYKKILEIAKSNKIKYVFFAHHLNDQIETFFYRVIRGTGNYGLICMKEVMEYKNIKLLRPFIDIEISKINVKKPKKFIVDKSNFDIKIDRNYIRKILLKIEKRFPFYRKTIKRFIKINTKNNSILDSISKLDFKKTNMKISKIIKIKNRVRRLNLLSYFLRIKKFFIPSKRWLEELDKQILSKKNFLMKKKKFCLFIKENKLCLK